MYYGSGPELLTQLKVKDTLRDAERLHRVSSVLNERRAARRALFTMNLTRFWNRQDGARLQPRNS